MISKQEPITEAIVLAGGLGTRLREAVPDLPKCMAPVAGHPFLYYIIKYYSSQGIQSFIFSLGYLHEIIETYLKEAFPNLTYKICLEDEPLGTGGAIQKALGYATANEVLILNGDTLFEVDLKKLHQTHHSSPTECTLALKSMSSFDRYGVVTLGNNNTVMNFLEKQYFDEGNINGGVYLLNTKVFNNKFFPEKFSFEKDYLEKYYTSTLIKGSIHNGYFIDIGIPQDFQKAQIDLAK